MGEVGTFQKRIFIFVPFFFENIPTYDHDENSEWCFFFFSGFSFVDVTDHGFGYCFRFNLDKTYIACCLITREDTPQSRTTLIPKHSSFER